MRNHNKAVLLRLTDQEFNILRMRASGGTQTTQEFLRDLLRYGVLPKLDILDGKKKLRKDLTA